VIRLLAWVRREWLTLLVIGALAVAYLVLRTPATQIGRADQLVAGLRQGRPSVIEFYSNT
jgi:hypothetical protein